MRERGPAKEPQSPSHRAARWRGGVGVIFGADISLKDCCDLPAHCRCCRPALLKNAAHRLPKNLVIRLFRFFKILCGVCGKSSEMIHRTPTHSNDGYASRIKRNLGEVAASARVLTNTVTTHKLFMASNCVNVPTHLRARWWKLSARLTAPSRFIGLASIKF